MSIHEETVNELFQFFSDLFQENQKLPKHHIAQYLNTIKAPKIGLTKEFCHFKILAKCRY